MSKAIGSILLIGAAIAINVFAPGIGGALGAAFSGTAIGGGVTVGGYIAAQAVLGIATLGLTVAGLSAASSLLFGGARAQPPQQTEGSLKSPIPVRVRGTGRRRLWGASMLYATASDGTTGDVWAFYDGKAHACVAVYLNDKVVTISGGYVQALADKTYQSNHVQAGYTLGPTPNVAFSAVIAKFGSLWTSNHRGDGIVTGYLLKRPDEQSAFLETYPQGDNVQMSLVLDLAPVFDPRDPAQDAYDESTWRYDSATAGPNPGENSALGLLWYLLKWRNVDYDTQIKPQLGRWIAAANDCDQAQALDAGGTEPRYRNCVVFNATEVPANVIADYLRTFDGWTQANERGEIVVYSGRFIEPTVTLTSDHIVSFRHQRGVAAEDAINEVTVQYVSADHDYATVDAEAWRDEAAISASGREPVSAALDAKIPSYTQGRRLAKRKRTRANAPHRGQITTNYSGQIMLGHRYLNVVLEMAGGTLYEGAIEVISDPVIDMNTGGITFDWVSIDASIDDWDPATEDGNGAPIPGNTDLGALSTPEITAANTILDSDGASSRIVVSGTGPDLPALSWLLRWRIRSGDWIEQTATNSASAPNFTLTSGVVPLADELEVQARAVATDGRRTDWSASAIIVTGSITADTTDVTADATTMTVDRT